MAVSIFSLNDSDDCPETSVLAEGTREGVYIDSFPLLCQGGPKDFRVIGTVHTLYYVQTAESGVVSQPFCLFVACLRQALEAP